MAVIPPPPCPDCKQPMATIQENRKWVCQAHGWYARLEDRIVVKSFYLKRQKFTLGPGEVGTNFRALMPRGRPQFRYLFYQLVGAARAGILRSAHDTSDGGLAVALAEACILGGRGARCDLSHFGGRADEVLFGEGPSRVVASIPVEGYEAFCAMCWRHRVPLRLLGRVGGMRLQVRLAQGAVDLPVATLREAYG